MGRFLLVAAAAVLFASACKDSKSEGLPPAEHWSASSASLPAVPQGQGNNPHAGANPHAGLAGNNPHAGIAGAPGNNPHAGIPGAPGGTDPHAGLNMGGPNDPHAGLDMGNPHGSPDVAAMGLPPPDPNRKIDPSRRVAGTIKIHPKAKDRVAAGGAVFVVIKAAGPDGAPVGPALAVEKLTWGTGDLKFELTEAQSMIAGTELKGDVVVTVRYDNDGDALSKSPGDVVGSARVTVPAQNVNIVLDDVL